MTRYMLMTGLIAATFAAAVPFGNATHALRAQTGTNGIDEPRVLDVVEDANAAKVPFGPGEDLRYRVKLGPMNVGEGHMRIEGIEEVRGHQTYHVSMGLKASVGFGMAKVDDSFDSWLDTKLLVSRRFIRDIHELNYKSRRIFEIYPEEKRWERTDADQSGDTPSILTLDEIAFLYFIRTLPLEIGDEYEFNRYFKEDGNPVRLKVLRKQRVEVPAGTFDAIVVQPIIQTDGLFSEGGEAEVFFSDDADRHMVYMRSSVPVVGSITLHLTSAERGTPLNPPSR